MIIESKIEDVFKWYEKEMRAAGRRVSFPRCADKTKTYLWRQIKNFVNKMEEMELDIGAIKKVISIAVDHAKHNKLLNRGAAILTKSDILEICHNKLVEELKQSKEFISEIKSCVLFLYGQKGKQSMPIVLMARRKRTSYANITCWFQSGRLSKAFIALSKSCCRALAKLDQQEREEFPTDIEILKIRAHSLRDDDRYDKLKKLMKSDLQRRE